MGKDLAEVESIGFAKFALSYMKGRHAGRIYINGGKQALTLKNEQVIIQ